MGIVYRALDLNLRRPVALKVLRPAFVADAERRARFLREARAAAAVSHPNIATVHEIGEAEGTTFIAMEFLEGRTLRAHLGEHPMPISEALRIAAQIAAGLAKAHEANIIHRDLKPDNVMIGPEGAPKILDFGLAKLLEEDTGPGQGELGQMATLPQQTTREGRVLGTAAYMSPEQARGKPVDARSDVFSFGVLLYEMVTGEVPFKGETITDTISAIIRDPAVPAAEVNPDIPPELDRIIAKCLHKQPDSRYQSSRDLLLDLREISGEADASTSVSMDRRASEAGYTHSGYTHSGYTRARPGSGPISSQGGGANGSARGRRPRARAPALAGLLVALLLVAALLQLPWFRRDRAPEGHAPPVEANTLAVHVVENLKDPKDPERLGQILQELIITDLSEMGSLKVFSSQRLFDIQKMLTDQEAPGFHREVATEIARRAGAETMLTGTLSQLDSRWILACQLVDVENGTIRTSERIDGTDLYSMVDTLAERIRTNLIAGAAGAGKRDVSVRDKTSPSLVAYRHHLDGMELLNKEEFEQAVAEFDSAVRIDPTFGQAYYALAIAKWWAGDAPENARIPLEKLLSGEVRVTEKQRKMGEAALLLVDRRYDDAVGIFEQLTRAYPDEKDVWYGLGEALYHNQATSNARAVEAFRRCAELDPTFYLAYHHIFDFYGERGLYGESAALSRRLIDLDPDRPAHYAQWIIALAREGKDSDLEEAIADGLARFPEDPDRAKIRLALGWAHYLRWDFERAEQVFQSLSESQTPRVQVDALRGLGQVRTALGDIEAAEGYIRRALEVSPENTQPINSLMEILFLSGRYGDGLALASEYQDHPQLGLFSKLIRLHCLTYLDRINEREAARAIASEALGSDQSAIHRLLAWADYEVGDYAAADREFRKLLDKHPDDLGVNDLTALSWGALMIRDYDQAESWASKTIEMNPHSGQGWVTLLELHAAKNDFPAAVRFMRTQSDRQLRPPHAMALLAGALVGAGDYVAADSLLDAARERFGASPALRFVLVGLSGPTPLGAAWWYADSDRPERVDELIAEAMSLDGEHVHPDASYTLACAALRAGRLDEAENAFRSCISAGHPKSMRQADCVLGLAAAALLRGDAKVAEKRVRDLLSDGLRYSRAYRLLAWSLAEQERYPEAATFAAKAMEMDPGLQSGSALAWTLVAGGTELAQGTKLARDATAGPGDRWDPTRTLAFVAPPEHTLGLAALKQERYEEAVGYLERAAEIRPERASIRRHLEEARDRLARTHG